VPIEIMHWLAKWCGPALLTFAVARASSMVSGMVVTNRNARNCAVLFQLPPTVIPEEPSEEYVVIGLIEVRTTRPKPINVLRDELIEQGTRLCADAVIPAKHDETRQKLVAAGAGPYRAFYVFDDGNAQVLEARGIRFTRNVAPEYRRASSR